MRGLTKISKKDIVAAVIIIAVLAVLILTTDIQTPEEFYSLHPDSVAEDGSFVTLTVECKDIENYEENSLGSIVPKTKFVLNEGESVFDIMEKAMRFERIELDYSGSPNIYIKGIDGLYEFDHGPASGWQYSVNGEVPEKSCGEFFPNSGDDIVFFYTCDYTKTGGAGE